MAAEAAKEAAEQQEHGEGEGEKPEHELLEFDLILFKRDFDEANPSVEIPPDVVDDIDNDFDLAYAAPSQEKEA